MILLYSLQIQTTTLLFIRVKQNNLYLRLKERVRFLNMLLTGNITEIIL